MLRNPLKTLTKQESTPSAARLPLCRRLGAGVGALALILASAAGSTSHAGTRQGGMDSGGGDIHSADHGAAWFLGDTTVPYCVQVSPDFGVNAEAVEQKIRENLDRWLTYLRVRIPNAIGIPVEWEKKERFLASHFSQTECNVETPLVFYFGTENERVAVAKKNFDQPIALAFRETYDAVSGRARGLVWFEKDGFVIGDLHSPQKRTLKWNRNNALDLMILHELGHVFGVSHVPGTIMDEDLAADYAVTPDYQSGPGLPVQIDQRRALVWPQDPSTFEIVGQFNAGVWGTAIGLSPDLKTDLPARMRVILESPQDRKIRVAVGLSIQTPEGVVEKVFDFNGDASTPRGTELRLGANFVIAYQDGTELRRRRFGKTESTESFVILVERQGSSLPIPAILFSNGDSMMDVTGVLNGQFRQFFVGRSINILRGNAPSLPPR